MFILVQPTFGYTLAMYYSIRVIDMKLFEGL